MMMFEVRKNHYDLVILPNSSSGDTINAALVNATNKVSAYDSKREFIFTHPLIIKDGYKHAALGPLSLLKTMGHKIDVVTNSHHLVYTAQEKKSAMAIAQKLIKDDSQFVTMAFFRGARGSKQLSNECWSRILERFDDAMSNTIQWVEILSPDIESPLREEYDVYQSSNLRELGLVLANLSGFICCDTGPLHLADAAGAKCIGLYTHTNIENFGVLGEKSVNITNIDNFNALSICRSLNLAT
ncbi:lipopolysaccharide heptosyltransferase family protein [Aliivibrio salmonicida]|uniref:Uncharacterized protein n=1 Tax=Aliivibrio salmonicida (strain LFI1238) TaxID=316275 RepID=B6EQX7_ALISL|nr:glycosyltransferase family 9 protein [Aliivibrio salmonicida]AZL86514.1 lipopolysaccharide heptosyltransferase family protein [Aliivibrio salmonicida]CAQ81107.1 hypothetical protein VSAL_II0353 [Aliivibrio salmonicida LFI1238]